MNGRILIVDDIATNRIVYKARFASAFYETLLAENGEACLRLAREESPDLILLDLNLPDMSGTEVVKQLRRHPETRDLPIIVLTATRNGEARLAALEAGADDVLIKPANDSRLMSRVRNLLRMRHSSKYSGPVDAQETFGFAEKPLAFDSGALIALVASPPESAARWVQDLQSKTRDRIVIQSRNQVLAEAGNSGGQETQNPDVFIIHDTVGVTHGVLKLLSELKSHAATSHSAVCLVSHQDDNDAVAMAFDLGADDVVVHDISGEELASRVRGLMRRKRLVDRQRATVQDSMRLAMLDPLTGLHNRRYAMPKLASIAAQAEDDGEEFAVMVVDLDRFKLVNDRFGHGAGDLVLVEVAQRLSANLRMTDVLARIGGEEFLVVLPRTPLAEARRVAERICGAIQEVPVRLPSGELLTVTVSIGVAVSNPSAVGCQIVSRLVDQADQALLESKSAGRNQVTFGQSAA